MTNMQQVFSLLNFMPSAEQHQVFSHLRQQFRIHPLETQWNVDAETILEAIHRSQDITQRGVRGIIAELCFWNYIIKPLSQGVWQNVPLTGALSYDALLQRNTDGRQVTIQVKNQRISKGVPLLATAQAPRKFAAHQGWWLAECQKTRNGQDEDGEETRPYRYGDFDILAVCLHPSTNDWSRFMFTPARMLTPRRDDQTLIDIMQPVSPVKAANWTDDLEECISWL